DRLRPVVRQGPVPGRADQFPICPGAGDRLHLHRRCRTARLRRWIGGPVGVHDPDLEDPGHRLQCSGPFRSLDRGRCRLDVRVPRLHQHRHDDGDHPRHGSPAALLEPGRFGVPRPHLRPGGGEFHLAASLARPRRALRGLRVESRDRTRTRAETSDDREDADRVVGRTGEEAHLAVRSATYHLPPTTYHLPLTTYHSPLTTHLPPAARHLTTLPVMMWHRGDRGWLEVICGPMFSGKSEELIRRVTRAAIARLPVQVFKPAIDDRYATTEIVSHSSLSVAAIPVDDSNELLEKVEDRTEVLGIDEGQFFDDGLVDVVD